MENEVKLVAVNKEVIELAKKHGHLSYIYFGVSPSGDLGLGLDQTAVMHGKDSKKDIYRIIEFLHNWMLEDRARDQPTNLN